LAHQTADVALAVDQVTKRFGGVVAVQDVSLHVPYGERHALLGSNGAGKSTLFSIIAGEYRPTAGRILLFGQDITRRSVAWRSRQGIGRTYQTALLFPTLTVRDHLYLAIRGCYSGRFSMRRARHDPHNEAALALAEQVGLSKVLGRAVASLSHGEQRQLEVGLSLAGNPRLVLLDEPAAGLSQSERDQLRDLLNALPRDLTIVLVEHDMDVALAVADQVTVMHQGQTIISGTPDEIASNQRVHDLYLGAHDER
jgi:branched-chain amino acid transport system ATP-binding protein